MPLNQSWFALPLKLSKLSGFKDAGVRFPIELPEKFINAYTKKGDKVFDPFSGFGTTLLAAQKLGRIGYGIEYDEKKVSYIQSQLNPNHKIIHGSSLNIKSYDLPKMDMSFTSPPYMRYFDKENPLTNYTKDGNYKSYLKGIGEIYSQIKTIMKKNALVIIEISNTFDQKHPMTPLAWDVGKVVSEHLYFERDFIYCVENSKLTSPTDNDNHSYCLMFRNK